jgi:hypothetical protein
MARAVAPASIATAPGPALRPSLVLDPLCRKLPLPLCLSSPWHGSLSPFSLSHSSAEHPGLAPLGARRQLMHKPQSLEIPCPSSR